MERENESKSGNSLLRALRGKGRESGGDEGEESPVVGETVRAMSLDDAEPVALPMKALGGSEPVTRSLSDENRIEAVVELLFGSHLADIHAGMRAMEKRLADESNRVEIEMRTRVESVDRHTKSELHALSEAVCEERGRCGEEVGKVDERMELAMREMEGRFEQMEGEFARRHQVLEDELSDKLARAAETTAQLRQSLEHDIEQMKLTLSGRAELGGLFTELGRRLEAKS